MQQAHRSKPPFKAPVSVGLPERGGAGRRRGPRWAWTARSTLWGWGGPAQVLCALCGTAGWAWAWAAACGAGI